MSEYKPDWFAIIGMWILLVVSVSCARAGLTWPAWFFGVLTGEAIAAVFAPLAKPAGAAIKRYLQQHPED